MEGRRAQYPLRRQGHPWGKPQSTWSDVPPRELAAKFGRRMRRLRYPMHPKARWKGQVAFMFDETLAKVVLS